MALSTPPLKTCKDGVSPLSFSKLPQSCASHLAKLISDGSFSNNRMETCVCSARNCDVNIGRKAQREKVTNITENLQVWVFLNKDFLVKDIRGMKANLKKCFAKLR